MTTLDYAYVLKREAVRRAEPTPGTPWPLVTSKKVDFQDCVCVLAHTTVASKRSERWTSVVRAVIIIIITNIIILGGKAI